MRFNLYCSRPVNIYDIPQIHQPLTCVRQELSQLKSVHRFEVVLCEVQSQTLTII